MKVHLALNFDSVNAQYHKPLWSSAVAEMGWTQSIIYEADFIVTWGVTPESVMGKNLKKPVLMIDFPYWNRAKRGEGKDYYKVSLNGQHPTPYVMRENHNDTRYFATGGNPIHPWKEGGEYILIAGMGPKAATKQYNMTAGQWERRIIDKIKQQTKMPIVYRPKPNRQVPPIAGTIYDDGTESIHKAVQRAHCMVCHHGNPTIDALFYGVPIFMNGTIGAASHLASFDFDNINIHYKPDNRQQFFNNLSHWQFSTHEIKSGYVLQDFKNRGFI